MSKPAVKQILHTDNDFRIITAGSKIIWLEHRCAYKRWEGDDWRLMWCDIGARDRECSLCRRSATPGLQAAFWFLKEERDA
jgi:hypothetical protein